MIAYHGAVTAGFVLDDYHLILGHRELGIGLIPRLCWRAYESGNAAFYRPLSMADLAIDRSLFGLWAPGFHAHNVVWHVAATLALGALLARVVAARVAFAAMVLFALHPVHTEAVTGVVGRSELMATTFVMVGCTLWLDGRRGWAALAYFAALASKESGVTLPLVAVMLEVYARPGTRVGAAMRRAWPMGVALAVYGVLRVHALAGATLPAPAEYFVGTSRWAATLTAVDVLGRDLRLLVWPHPLSADYSYPALPMASGLGAALAVAMLAAWAAAAWRTPKPVPVPVPVPVPDAIRIGFWWFVLTVLPVSNLGVHIGVLMAERLLYLPSVGVCLVGGVAVAWLAERVRPRVANGALAAVALSFAMLTMARNLDWQTPLALWRDTVAKQPRSALAHGNLALSCEVVGDRKCVVDELRQAVALDPQRADFRAALEQRTR